MSRSVTRVRPLASSIGRDRRRAPPRGSGLSAGGAAGCARAAATRTRGGYDARLSSARTTLRISRWRSPSAEVASERSMASLRVLLISVW